MNPPSPALPPNRKPGFSIFDLAPEGIRQSLPAAVRVMLISVVVAAPFLLGGLYLLEYSLQSLHDVAPGLGSDFRFSRAPMMLAGLLGTAFGFVLGKVVTNSSGLVGWPAFFIGAVGSFLLVGTGAMAGSFLFPSEPPPIFSYCLSCVALMSLLGICFNSFWAS